VIRSGITLTVLAAGCALFSAPSGTAAQDARTSSPDEIIVTSTRRETSLRNTPLSVGVLSGSDLDSMGARDIVDYFEHAPGLGYNEDGFGGYRIAIRGIAAGTFVESRPLSAFYLDDTPMMTVASGSIGNPQWGGARPQALDIARVEVLRGPQGTLFGAGALGGAVRMITNPPDLERFYGSADALYSVTAHGGNNHSLSGVINAPLVADRLALRGVGYRRSDDGYVDNGQSSRANVNEAETTGARVALLWNAAPKLAMTFRAYGQKRESGGLAAADRGAAEYEQIRYVSEHDDEAWKLFAVDLDYDSPRVRLELASSRLEREPEFAIDNTRFVNRFLGVFNPTTNDFDDSVQDAIHELRITSATDARLTWLGGAYYQLQERTWQQRHASPGFDALTGGLAASFGYPDTLFVSVYSGTLRQHALYGELGYEFSPLWRATIGARWFEFDYDIDDASDGLFAGGPSAVRASSDENGVTPKLGFDYRPSERALVFINIAEGFRAGGTNEYTDRNLVNCADALAALAIGVPPPRGFESDSVWNYELGSRTTWLAERLVASVTVHHTVWRDMQTPRTIACPNDLMNIIENVGKTTSDGLEIELTWLPKDQLEVVVSSARTDAKLASDAPTVSGEKGERIPTVPEWTLAASIKGEFKLVGPVRGFVRADYRYVGDSWSDFDDMNRRRTPARRVVDVRFGALVESWRLELFADNLFDERGVLLHTSNVVGEWQVLMQPRTVGVQARVAF
jgi:iron complex outermembrane receptor protein